MVTYEVGGKQFKFNKQGKDYTLWHCVNKNTCSCKSIHKLFDSGETETSGHSGKCLQRNPERNPGRKTVDAKEGSTHLSKENETIYLKQKIEMLEAMVQKKDDLKNLSEKINSFDSVNEEILIGEALSEISEIPLDKSFSFSESIDKNSISENSFFRSLNSSQWSTQLSEQRSAQRSTTQWQYPTLKKNGKEKEKITLLVNKCVSPFLRLFFLKIKEFHQDHKAKKFYHIKPVRFVVEKYERRFKRDEIYACPDCGITCSGKHYHRHIDECKNSQWEKEFCLKCRRECVKEIRNVSENIIAHQHKCSRKVKIERTPKPESIKRRKRRLINPCKPTPKIKYSYKRNFIGNAEIMYLKRIVDEFINEKRYRRIEFYKNLRDGYPEEFLNMYYSENYSNHFREHFNHWIGKFGKFVGDTTIDKIPFTVEKANRVFKKYQFDFEENSILSADNFLKNNPIPSHRKPKIHDSLFVTYLLACADRRQVDVQLKLGDYFGNQI